MDFVPQNGNARTAAQGGPQPAFPAISANRPLESRMSPLALARQRLLCFMDEQSFSKTDACLVKSLNALAELLSRLERGERAKMIPIYDTSLIAGKYAKPAIKAEITNSERPPLISEDIAAVFYVVANMVQEHPSGKVNAMISRTSDGMDTLIMASGTRVVPLGREVNDALKAALSELGGSMSPNGSSVSICVSHASELMNGG